MTLLPTPLPANLLGQARWRGVKTMLLGLVAFPVGLALCVIAGPCGILFGLICIFGSFFAVPVGLWWTLVPTAHNSMRSLGASSAERAATVATIEAEMAEPLARHLPLKGRTVLSLTEGWAVVTGSDLVILRREDLLWFYKVVVTRKRYGITMGRTFQLAIHGRRTGKDEVDVLEAELPDALAELQGFAPHALTGYDALIERLSSDQLAARVDGQRGHAVPPAAWPAAPVQSQAAAAGPTAPYAAGQSSGAMQGSAVLPARAGFGLAGGVLGAVALGGLLLCGSCLGLVGLGQWLESRMLPLAGACSGSPVPGAATGPITSRSAIATMAWTGAEWDQPAGLIGTDFKEAHSLEKAALCFVSASPAW